MAFFSSRRVHAVRHKLLLGAAALSGLAVANALAARRADRRHPPQGRFLTVDGVRLHYRDEGLGSPVVLIHGNAVSGDDWHTSGVADLLRRDHRVIIFDRPGFGHSDRPHGRLWTAAAQADLLHRAIRQLGIERPVVVGHSWGAIVALAMAADHPGDVAGLVLVSGYYFWTLRPDVLPVALGAIPILGDVLAHTIGPVLGWLQMPLLIRAMFSPARTPARFRAEYAPSVALRPKQVRSSAQDGALMIPSVLALRRRYRDLFLPTMIFAGEADRIVFRRRADRLHATLPNSDLEVVGHVGHMLHHIVPGRVAAAVRRIAGESRFTRKRECRRAGNGRTGSPSIASQ